MAASAILNFDQFSTFDLDDIEGLVIPLSWSFPGRGVHFWSYFLDTGSRLNQRLKVKVNPKSPKNHLYSLIICGSLHTYSTIYVNSDMYFFGYGVDVRLNQRSKLSLNHTKKITSIHRLYVVCCVLIPSCQVLLGWVGRYMYV